MSVLLPSAAAAAILAVALAVSELRSGRGVSRRLEPYARAVETVSVGRSFRRVPGRVRLEALLDRADVRVSTTKLIAIVVGCGTLAGLLALELGVRPVALPLVLLLGAGGLRAVLELRIRRRRRAFDDQLPEILRELGNAMRAGHGFDQALQGVAADAEEPARRELARVLAEVRLGRPFEEALADLGARFASRDLDFVLDSIVVQRQVGGSLAGIFEVVGETVTQRHQFAMRLRSLTALGRISALVLLALPFVLALGLTAVNHHYLAPLFQSSGGRLALFASLAAMGVGAIWLRRIASCGAAA